MSTPPDSDDDRQFTPAERRALRKMMEDEERLTWLWKSARVWMSYVSAAIISAFAVYKALQEWFPILFKKVS